MPTAFRHQINEHLPHRRSSSSSGYRPLERLCLATPQCNKKGAKSELRDIEIDRIEASPVCIESLFIKGCIDICTKAIKPRR